MAQQIVVPGSEDLSDLPADAYDSDENMWAALQFILRENSGHRAFGVSTFEQFQDLLKGCDRMFKFDDALLNYLEIVDPGQIVEDTVLHRIIRHIGRCLAKKYTSIGVMFVRLAEFFVHELIIRCGLSSERKKYYRLLERERAGRQRHRRANSGGRVQRERGLFDSDSE